MRRIEKGKRGRILYLMLVDEMENVRLRKRVKRTNKETSAKERRDDRRRKEEKRKNDVLRHRDMIRGKLRSDGSASSKAALEFIKIRSNICCFCEGLFFEHSVVVWNL